MAKIRGIKPEFWTDEAIVELSPLARLLFIGMWNFACDNGHLADKPRQIKMRILPADDGVDVGQLLTELVAQGRIQRDAGTITIHRFAHHQKPHKHWWTTCDLPGCERPEGAPPPESNRGSTVAQPLTTSRPTADVEVDCDVDVDGEGENKPSAASRFGEFYELYPKKVNRKAAEARFRTAAKRVGADVIIDGLKRQLPTLRQSEVKFIPAPDVWLNKGKWEDEVTTEPAETIPDYWQKALG